MKMKSNKYFANSNLSVAMDILKSQKMGLCKRLIYPLLSNLQEFDDMSRGSNQKSEDFLFDIMRNNWNSISEYIIDDNCLMIFDIVIVDDIMTKANIQVFVLENCELLNFCTEDDYKRLIVENKHKLYYYRLDYHPDNIGKIFAEPLPHIHTNVKKVPRFNMSYEKDDFIFAFLENIFINHYYDSWEKWMKKSISGNYLDDFEKITIKYKDNKADEIIEVYSKILEDIKENIQVERRKHFIWFTDEKFRRTLSYGT